MGITSTRKEPHLEITEHTGKGYKPCIDFEGWRVAVLRYISDVAAENITHLERHNETDEVFVLLEGRCILFIEDSLDVDHGIQGVEMAPSKLYNIKKGTYHNHALSQDAVVLIVENQDTGDSNSEKILLTPGQRNQIIKLSNSLRGK